MRPRKRILLVDANEYALSMRKVLLETRGHYRVITALGPEQALELFADGVGIDLVICELALVGPGMIGGNEMIRRMKERNPSARAMLTSAKIRALRISHADRFLFKGSPDELLANADFLAQRKRGPKPVIVPTVIEAASA